MKQKLYSAIIAISAMLIFCASYATEFQPIVKDVKNYDWIEHTGRSMLTVKEERDYAAVIVKDIQAYEYVYGKDGLELYSLSHRVIRVNNDEGINSFNQIYIPIGNTEEIIKIKARSIGANGRIIELDESEIKEIKDGEEGGAYRIFAIEGLETGSEIEYLCISRDHLNYFGRALFQLAIPSKSVHFELIAPSNLVFAAKSYNDFPQCRDTVENDKRIMVASLQNVPELRNEDFCFIHANRMRVEFKLHSDNLQGDKPLLTWNDAAQNIYANIYNVSKSEKKGIAKLLKEIKINKKDTEEDKIRKIENHVKTNFMVQENYAAQFYHLGSVIHNKYGNKTGIIKLFANLFKKAGIPHELVLTTSRDMVKFDKDFESWNYLSDYLIFFPGTKKFLTPEKFEYRYGMIPFLNTHNYGLFVWPVNHGKFYSVKWDIKFIPASDYLENYDNLDVMVSFNDNIAKAEMAIKREMSGYSGVYIQPYFSFLQEDKKRMLLEELVKMSAEDATFKKIGVENTEANMSPLKSPFRITADIESSSLIEKAGNKFLFKLGKVIGPQTELYQDSQRRNDVENDFNRSYSRKVIVDIPENYKVVNLDDIKMNVFFEKDGDRIFSFVSDYKVEGSSIIANVTEYYKVINCSRENFEEFRKVINAAADFNKIMLIFERKEQ